jgi:hypothetical protein
LAERVLGKDEVTGSIPVIGSRLRLAEAIWGGEKADAAAKETNQNAGFHF